MLGLPEQLLMFMLAHLLFAPLDYASHTLTSFYSILTYYSQQQGEKKLPIYPFTAQ